MCDMHAHAAPSLGAKHHELQLEPTPLPHTFPGLGKP